MNERPWTPVSDSRWEHLSGYSVVRVHRDAHETG